MAKDAATQPRISVNKLAEFITAKAPRQRQILRDQKYPQDYKGMYYREASDAVSQCIASNLENTAVIQRTIALLEQQSPEKIGTQRRIASNVDALETFETMLDDINLLEATPNLGQHSQPRLKIHNVDVSVRPEIILTGEGKKKTPLIGALKLHFSRNFALDEDAGGFVSAILQEYSKTYLIGNAEPYGPYCMVIDIGSKHVWPGVKSTANRMKEIAANCRKYCCALAHDRSGRLMS